MTYLCPVKKPDSRISARNVDWENKRKGAPDLRKGLNIELGKTIKNRNFFSKVKREPDPQRKGMRYGKPKGRMEPVAATRGDRCGQAPQRS